MNQQPQSAIAFMFDSTLGSYQINGATCLKLRQSRNITLGASKVNNQITDLKKRSFASSIFIFPWKSCVISMWSACLFKCISICQNRVDIWRQNFESKILYSSCLISLSCVRHIIQMEGSCLLWTLWYGMAVWQTNNHIMGVYLFADRLMTISLTSRFKTECPADA